LIQTNTGYDELFKAGTFGAQIADNDHKVRYASANSPILSERIMCAAKEGAVNLDKHTLLKSYPIEGGDVYWQEDITDITALLEKLEENKETIAESTRICYRFGGYIGERCFRAKVLKHPPRKKGAENGKALLVSL
jgi:hypothetical protein